MHPAISKRNIGSYTTLTAMVSKERRRLAGNSLEPSCLSLRCASYSESPAIAARSGTLAMIKEYF